MLEKDTHSGHHILALDGGSMTIRASWFSQNGELKQISRDEFGNPFTEVYGTRIIPPGAWADLASRLYSLGQQADQIVVTGALKNPVHMVNAAGEAYQILGSMKPLTPQLDVNEVAYQTCRRRPTPGQADYAATKLPLLTQDPKWQETLGKPEQVGSRIGAFVAAALGLNSTIIAEPDRPGWTLDGNNLDHLREVLQSFGFHETDYDAAPKQFLHQGKEVYTAGDIVENLIFYHWLINQGVIHPDAIMFEGDTYAKIIRQSPHEGDVLNSSLEGMHYDKESMGAAINGIIVPAFEPFFDKAQAALDYNYPFRFASQQAAGKMDQINASPFYLIPGKTPTLWVERGDDLEEIAFADLPQDLDVIALAAASAYVSSAINTTAHIAPGSFTLPTDVHLYSGWFRENQPAAAAAFCGVLPENAAMYLDEIPDSAGVAVVNSRIHAGDVINPLHFVTLKPLDLPKHRFGDYVIRWQHARDHVLTRQR